MVLTVGPLAAISDFILSISDLTTLLGALTSGALLGYTIAQHAESLKEITELPILNFRSTYTPAAAYELFQALGPEGVQGLLNLHVWKGNS